MAFINRIKEVKPSNFIHNFKRYYFQIPTSRFVNRTTTSEKFPHHLFLANTSKTGAIYQLGEDYFNIRVRFFAAPVQFKKKEDGVINPNRPRLNDEITAQFLRLVTDEGHSIISLQEAMTRARNLELDLVEVDRDAKPPVCKIMNYSRERYKKQVREKERAKSKAAGSLKAGTCKEVRVSAKAELKDLKLKADSVRRLMERGYRVKCTATGAEDQDLCGLLSQLSAMIEDIAFVESGPKLETKQAHLVVRHIKFGTGKKGGGKKASKDKSTASPKKGDSPLGIVEESCDEESGTDNDEVEAPSLSVTAVSSSDYNASNLSPSKNPNATGLNVRPVSRELENRYARSPPKDDSAARNPVRFPNNRTEPLPQPHPNPSVPARDVSRQNRGSIPLPNGPQQSGRLPSDDKYQARGKIPFQTTQPNSRSGPNGRREPPSNVGGPESKLTGFGIFSKKVEGNNPNSAHPSGPGVVPGNLNPTTPQSNGPQKSESTEKKFGIFSR